MPRVGRKRDGKKYEKNPGQEAYRQFKKALAQGPWALCTSFMGRRPISGTTIWTR